MEASKRKANDVADALSSPTNPSHWFAYASAAYLFVLSLPLLLFPRLLLILSTPRGAAGQASQGKLNAGSDPVSAIGPELTPLERYSSYSNAITMLTLASMILVLSGAIPVTTSPTPDSSSSGKSPFRIPVVVITTVYFALSAFISWNQAGTKPSTTGLNAGQINPHELGIGSFGKVVGFGHALFAFWGLAVFMFGNDLTRNKKKGGDSSAKDKSVSSFPFKSKLLLLHTLHSHVTDLTS